MEDLSIYRLNDLTEIESLKKEPGFETFRIDVYRYFRSMPLERINIEKEVRPENRRWFVKVGCMWIREGNSDYVFSGDFRFFRREEKVETTIAWMKEELRKKRQRKEQQKTEA